MNSHDSRPNAAEPTSFDIVVAIAAVGAVVLLVRLGLGLTFFADEWAVIADRAVTVQDLLRPFNEHWLAVTIVVYRGRCSVSSGWAATCRTSPVLAVLHATVAILVYTLVRRRTLPVVAVGMTLVVLLFGSGFENLFWGIQIGFVGATALGLGALLLLDDVPTLPGPGRRRRRRPPDRRGHDLRLRPVHARARRARRPPRSASSSLGRAAARPGRALRGLVRDARPERDRDLREPVHARDARRAPALHRRRDGDGARRGGGRWRADGPDPDRRARRLDRLSRSAPAADPRSRDRLPAGDRRRVHDRRDRPGAARGRCVALHALRLPVRASSP